MIVASRWSRLTVVSQDVVLKIVGSCCSQKPETMYLAPFSSMCKGTFAVHWQNNEKVKAVKISVFQFAFALCRGRV